MYPKLHLSVRFQRTQPAVLSNSSLLDSKTRPKVSMLASILKAEAWIVLFLHLLSLVRHLRPCLRSYLDQKLFLTAQPPVSSF